MLAHVESAQSIRQPLVYNEQKVEEKKAIFLDARNFWQEKEDLSLRDKMQRFNSLTVLNERSQKKIIHISVNFHPDDQLTDRQMTSLARKFMEGIAFGDQPWLLYRHIDAGHPHMHIVTTNIQPNGARIPNDLRSPANLMKICSGIESEHHLTPALAPHDEFLQYGNDVQRIIYGQIPTRTGIEMVLNYVTEKYVFTSLDAYNAILGMYNVRADRGNPDGVMYQNRGMYYRLIDEQGRKVGAPIKASDFHVPATLNVIEEKCKLNRELATEYQREGLRISINYYLAGKQVPSLGKFRQDLALKRIRVIIPAFTRRGTRGPAPADSPGMFYLDLKSRTIFRDTELGPDFTAPAILRRCGLDKTLPELARQQQLELKRGERTLLDNADLSHAPTRDLFLRLSVQHDRLVAARESLGSLSQQHTHRHRHSL